jgi:hypothetical protein
MELNLFLLAIFVLFGFAIFDLIVGVSNDAVNFLNSSIGSRVAPRYIILIIASLGILAGVTFSSGMMEVARKGIFHPKLFTMPELITLFLAVMITDVILLDFFNTYGLPTSTTVSIVFELLGAAVAVSILKIITTSGTLSSLAEYINSAKAMIIIGGIFLSVIVSFIFGALFQFLSRLLFTFDYMKRIKRFGALWGGFALALITYFILVKGSKGASFLSSEAMEWIKTNWFVIMLVIFLISALILQILIFFKVNILKPIVLIGTFALAMAFAANDLVNFIGVPMAGFHAYDFAEKSGAPLTVTMDALGQKVPTETYLLLLAGLIMVITLWISRKARTVTETEINLGKQEEGAERFGSSFPSRVIVGLVINFFEAVKFITPKFLQRMVRSRMDISAYRAHTDAGNRPSFDLLRASVNLMVASAVISYATSHKLPLSTTYVTFMVAMGSSFADRAWGRENAVYRVTGVLTVLGGWFLTAFSAFSISCIFGVIIFYGKGYGILGLLALVAVFLWRNHHHHDKKLEMAKKDTIFNLTKVNNISETVSITFEHVSIFLHEIRESLDKTIEALFNQNEYGLAAERKKTYKINQWSNIIIANIFKSLRFLQKEDHKHYSYNRIIRRLQRLSNGYCDIVIRSHDHVKNHHKGLLDVQVSELKQIKSHLINIINEVELLLSQKQIGKSESIKMKADELQKLSSGFEENQLKRIHTEESKTRHSILYFAILGNANMMSVQNIKLLDIFNESFSNVYTKNKELSEDKE